MRQKFLAPILLCQILTIVHSEVDLTTKNAPLTSDIFIPIQSIPGTNLFTGIFYQIRMPAFPTGFITWTNWKVENHDGNYIQIDINPHNLPHYNPGQKWYSDVQWVFEPSEKDGYFTLRNKAIFNGITTSRYENRTEYRHLIIAREPHLVANLSEESSPLREEVLLKPIYVEMERDLYQINLFQFPENAVTWTYAKYGKYNHYIEVAKNDNKSKLAYKKEGGKWWNDTLFSFEIPPKGIELEGSFQTFETTLNPQEMEEMVKQHGKRVLHKKLVVHPSSTQAPHIVTQEVEIENRFQLNIDQDISSFTNVHVIVTLDGKRLADFKNKLNSKNPQLMVHKEREIVTAKSHIPLEDVKSSEVYVFTDNLENVKIPFKALMQVQVFSDRMRSNHSGILKGPLPTEFALKELKEAGFSVKEIRTEDNKEYVDVWVTGTLKGSFVIDQGITTYLPE